MLNWFVNKSWAN